ncbi:MAG: ATP-binding protein [Myxococcota bacterium]|nr:ATP-binding protein [Myxococcota bacterium]
MTLMLTSSASYFLERRHGQRPMFAITLMLIAWTTLTLGTATSGIGRLFPPVLVAAPIFSGYIGPSLFIYTRQLTTPHKPASLRWFWLGIFGTTYSVLSLSMPDGLHYATQAIVHQQAYWHPVLSPIMTMQSIQLVSFSVVSTGLITRAFWTGSRPDLRQTQFWLLITCWTCLVILLVTSVLPIFNITLIEVEPAAMTLPIALVGLMGVRALGDEMASLQTGQTDARAGRMESLGRMARGLAHDLNNILSAIVGHAELTAYKVKDQAAALNHLKQIIRDSERAAELLNRMMTYSGRLDRPRKVIDPLPAIETAFHSIQPLQPSSCRMTLEITNTLPLIRIEPSALSSAIENLLSNALFALEGRTGRVTLRAFVESRASIPPDAFGRPLDNQGTLRIEVEDTGRGMNTAEASRALEPFFSTRPNGKGLGLVSVLSTVRGAGGALWFSSEPGSGTRFVLWLPVALPLSSSTPFTDRALATHALVVDDSPEIRGVFEQLLSTFGMTAHGCPSAEATIDFLERSDVPELELALVDIRLGAMDGIELGHRLLHHYGFSAIIFVSGDEPGPRLAQFSDQPVAFIRKPASREAIMAALGELGFHLPTAEPPRALIGHGRRPGVSNTSPPASIL